MEVPFYLTPLLSTVFNDKPHLQCPTNRDPLQHLTLLQDEVCSYCSCHHAGRLYSRTIRSRCKFHHDLVFQPEKHSWFILQQCLCCITKIYLPYLRYSVSPPVARTKPVTRNVAHRYVQFHVWTLVFVLFMFKKKYTANRRCNTFSESLGWAELLLKSAFYFQCFDWPRLYRDLKRHKLNKKGVSPCCVQYQSLSKRRPQKCVCNYVQT